MRKRFIYRVKRQVARYATPIHLVLSLLFAYVVLDWVLKRGGWGHTVQESPVPVGDIGRGAELVRMLNALSPVEGDVGWYLLGTLVTPAGEPVALVGNREGRRTVRAGQALNERWRVVSVNMGLITLQSDQGIETFELPAHRVISRRTYRGTAPRADVYRRAAFELLSSVHWQQVPLGGGFVGLRVLSPVPSHISQTLGLRDGDVVESVNGLPLQAGNEVESLYERFLRDDIVTLGVLNNRERGHIRVTLYD